MSDELTVDIFVTSETTQEQRRTIEVEYQLPSYGTEDDLDVHVLVEIDDRYLGEAETETPDGGLDFVAFDHVFATPGEREIWTEVTVTDPDDETIDERTTVTLTVTGESIRVDLTEEDDRARIAKERFEEGGWAVDSDDSEVILEDQQGPVTVEAESHTTTYTKEELQEYIYEETFGEVDERLAMFFTSWIQFDPPIDDLPAEPQEMVEEVDEDARQQFLDEMEDSGLENIEVKDRFTRDIAAGYIGDITEYTATYEFEPVEFGVAGDETLEIPGDHLEIGARYGIWSDDEHVLVGGGAYPASDFILEVIDDITTAVEVELEIDMELTPDEYEIEAAELLRSIRSPEA